MQVKMMMILSKDGIRSIDANAIYALCIHKTNHDIVVNNVGMHISNNDKYAVIGYINRAQFQSAGNNIELLGTYETLPEAKRILAILTNRLQQLKEIPYGTFDMRKL